MDTDLCPPWMPSIIWAILHRKIWVNYPPVDVPTQEILAALTAYHVSYITGEAGIASRQEAAAIMAKGVAHLERLAGETAE